MAAVRRRRALRKPPRWVWFAPLGIALLLLAYIFLLGAPPPGTDPALLFNDPATTIWRNSPIQYMFVGTMSQISAVMWLIGASLSLFAVLSLWRVGRAVRLTAFLAAFSVLGFVMGFDDLLVFHERIVQDLSGGVIGQHHLLLLYAVMWAAFFVVFRRDALRTAPAFLAVMLALLGMSYSMDIATDLLPFIDLSAYKAQLDLVEEGLKFLGTVAFATASLRLALIGLDASRQQPPSE